MMQSASLATESLENSLVDGAVADSAPLNQHTPVEDGSLVPAADPEPSAEVSSTPLSMTTCARF